MRKHLILTALALGGLLLATVPAAAEESPSPSAAVSGTTTTPLERVNAYVAPSVVYIGISWSGAVYDTFNKSFLNFGDPFTTTFGCTGYVVNPNGYIGTAGHCVDPAEGAASLYEQAAQWALDNGYYASTTLDLETIIGFGDYIIKNPGSRRPDRTVDVAWGVSAGGVKTGQALPARVVKAQKFSLGDGALLKVEATDLNALPLSEEKLSVGTQIVAIGYPAAVDLVTDATFTPSFKEGSISSVKTVSRGLLTVYEISAAVSGGMSGGPTVNLDGEVVGFNSFGINSAIETQQFNFVRPASSIAELLADAGQTNELSQDTLDYRAGLAALFEGDKETAVEKLSSVKESQPTNEFASTYLDEAKALPDPPKAKPDTKSESGSGGVLLMVLLGVGVLFVLVVGGVLLLLRRNKRRGVTRVTPLPAGGQQLPGPPMGALPPGMPTPPQVSAPGTGSGATTIVAEAPQSTAGPVQHGVYCPDCGAHHDQGQKFCEECGAKL